ncbi:hypothetical protein R5R35_009996 [Gryllus longicercus]|uniref:Uncharacterized protein n=1 Tax=Gryllus longicercus TaxID=2509291 RepID=A0AAN9ZCJ3_9ORTH
MQWKPYETSLNLARAVGCFVGDDAEVLECLRHVDPIELVLAARFDAPLPRDRDRIMTFYLQLCGGGAASAWGRNFHNGNPRRASETWLPT